METTPVSTTTRTTKVRATKAAESPARKSTKTLSVSSKPKAVPKPVIQPSISAPVSEVELNNMIATAAYFIAAQRGFSPGNDLHDWLQAEHQILANLGKQ